MALLLTETDVRELLTMADAIAAVERITRLQGEGQAILHPRHRLELPDKGFLHYMAGADVAAGLVGMKIYTSVRGALRFLVLLYGSATGELLAMIEADHLGMMRTGAASAVATRFMGRRDARILAIIGTGHQARGQLQALAQLRRWETIRVFGRDPARRQRFATEMSAALGTRVTAADSAEQAVRDAQVISTATTSSRPVLDGHWLAGGAHLNAIGGNFPQKRELDAVAIERVTRVCVDSLEQARLESGDLIQGFADHPERWSKVHELADIVAGKMAGREGAEEITLFKSNGIAIWDVAVAARVVELAAAQNRGRKMAMWSEGG